MTVRPFRFRYANELAGAFVILSIVLLVGGIVAAGRAQGWFERKLVIHTRFETEEGAFGLQEGNEVRIRQTLAGRVGKIMPVADGSMEASFIVPDRFRSLITKDSVAKVAKKFGVAGDAFIEIEKGNGAPIEDGDYIVTKQDEEIMEIAKKALSDVQEVVLPLLDETKKILQHVNGILGSVDEGKGTVGMLINDRKFADQIRTTTDNVNYLLQDFQDTIIETTRLMKGAQKLWPFKKHIEKDETTVFIAPRRFNDVEMRRYGNRFRAGLEQARTANRPREIARNAYNLAVCLMSEGKYDEIDALLREADAESGGDKEILLRNRLVEAELTKRTGSVTQAVEIVASAVKAAGDSVSRSMEAESRLILASFQSEAGFSEDAKATLKGVQRLVKRQDNVRIQAMAAKVNGQVLSGDGANLAAAEQFDKAANLSQRSGSFYEMASALETAGRAYERAGKTAEAADRFFKAGRSWLSAGYKENGLKSLLEAVPHAKATRADFILTQIESMTNQSTRVSIPEPSQEMLAPIAPVPDKADAK